MFFSFHSNYPAKRPSALDQTNYTQSLGWIFFPYAFPTTRENTPFLNSSLIPLITEPQALEPPAWAQIQGQPCTNKVFHYHNIPHIWFMVNRYKSPVSPVFCCTWGLRALENKLPNSATTWLLNIRRRHLGVHLFKWHLVLLSYLIFVLWSA